MYPLAVERGSSAKPVLEARLGCAARDLKVAEVRRESDDKLAVGVRNLLAETEAEAISHASCFDF